MTTLVTTTTPLLMKKLRRLRQSKLVRKIPRKKTNLGKHVQLLFWRKGLPSWKQQQMLVWTTTRWRALSKVSRLLELPW